MKALEAMCRESADKAFQHLLSTMDNVDAPENVRLAAAREILDRGFGKPVDRTAILQLTKLDADGEVQPEEMTTPELHAILQRSKENASKIIDLKPEDSA